MGFITGGFEGGMVLDSKIRMTNMAFAQLAKREDKLYHLYGVHCGLSDPAVWALYALCEDEEKTYTQNDLVSMWSFPKQTMNYTVGVLVKNGWVRLEQMPGARNSKAIHLTEEGERVCEEKILPLMLAEEKSLSRMTEEERALLLRLTEKQCTYFEEEIQKIMGEKSERSL